MEQHRITAPDTPRPSRTAAWSTSRLAAGTIALVLSAVAALGAPRAASAEGVLVELFTSQGCSSCPPADRALGELAGRPDVVALSFHVDYWDYLGWRDTFADALFSARQFAYRDTWGARVVYTPQMVVGGDLPVQGNRADEVNDAVAVAQESAGDGQIVIERGKMVTARLEGLPDEAVIWTVRYVREADVVIKRGENAGRTIAYHNVVRNIARLGTAGEAPAALTLPQPGPDEGIAVWAQGGDGYGRVLAVASYEGGAGG
ncbi:MAG: DUF1223 domain-containing protein [Pseudomonadota bacterium]